MKLEIDYEEFLKQLKEQIIKADSYVQIEILISDKVEMPYVVIDKHKCGFIEQAKAIVSLKDLIEELEKNPLSAILSKNMSCKSETIKLKK